MKHCSKCKAEKDLSDFSPNKRVKSGLASWCRTCVSEYNRSEPNKLKHRKRTVKFRAKTQKPKTARALEIEAVISGKSKIISCLCCLEVKPLSDFSPKKGKTFSVSSSCRKCQAIKQAAKTRAKRDRLPIGRFDKWSNAEKVKARSKVSSGIALGSITSQPCVVCGNKKTQGHHEDYDKPLDLIWLCSEHHAKAHSFGLESL